MENEQDSLVKDTSQLIDEKKARDHLKFGEVKDISYCMFLKESSSFAINFLADQVTIIIAYILYNISNEPQNIASTGFCFGFFMRFMRFGLDFQEPITIIMGPYYSKKDMRNYNISFWRLVFLNIVMFLVNIIVCALIIKPFYQLINLEEKFVDPYTMYTIYFMVFFGPIYSITNFCRGSLNFIMNKFNSVPFK